MVKLIDGQTPNAGNKLCCLPREMARLVKLTRLSLEGTYPQP